MVSHGYRIMEYSTFIMPTVVLPSRTLRMTSPETGSVMSSFTKDVQSNHRLEIPAGMF